MTTQQSNSQATIYLISSRNWNNWFSVAKFTDLKLKIWDYMNSDNLKEFLLSTESSESTVFQIKADTTMIINLKEDELSQYNYLCKIWKKKKLHLRKLSKILQIFTLIFISLSISIWLIISLKMKILFTKSWKLSKTNTACW